MLKIADNKYLTRGDKILRKKLVEIFNVSNQAGITLSNKNKLIFLFSDPRIDIKLYMSKTRFFHY